MEPQESRQNHNREPQKIPLEKVEEILLQLADKIIILASYKNETLDSISQSLHIPANDIYGTDAEYASVSSNLRVTEPVSETPLIPTLFKIYRLLDFLAELKREQLIHNPFSLAAMTLMTKYSAESGEHTQAEIDQILYEASLEPAKKFADQYLVMASDIVMSINHQDVHRLTRDGQESSLELDGSEEARQVEADISQRHSKPALVEWQCAFAVAQGGTVRLCQFVIETTVPALPEDQRAELIREYFNPRVSGGLKIIELMKLFPQQLFYVHNLDSSQRYVISPQKAEWIVVNKVLPREIYGQLLSNQSIPGTVEGSSIKQAKDFVEYEVVPIAIAQLGGWFSQDVVQ